jgi:hypothetical protein
MSARGRCRGKWCCWPRPAAALGGFVARPLALWLGARRLKTIDGMWIVLSSLYLIWLNWR